MPLRRVPRCLIISLVFALCLPLSSQSARELTIYAASSLTDAFEALAAAFEAKQADVAVTLNFSSSSRLAAQLLAGGRADIFASANQAQLEKVIDDGRIDAESVAVFAINQLVLITPADDPAGIDSVEDLAGGPLLLVLAVRGTPIRGYSDAMLVSHQDEYGADFADRALANLVSEESNVRQVTTRVALGEADAGIVYRSDVNGDIGESLRIIPIAARHNQIASYPIASLTDALQPALAASFIEFTLSEAGQAILREHGFCPPIAQTEQPKLTATPSAESSDAEDEATAAEADDCETANATA